MPRKIETAKQAYNAWLREDSARRKLGEEAYKRGGRIFMLAIQIVELTTGEGLDLHSLIPEKEIREQIQAQAKYTKRILKVTGLEERILKKR